MFQLLTQNLSKIFDKIRGSGVINEEQLDTIMRDIRVSLLEADVALPVARDFISSVKKAALGQEIIKSVSPSQMIVKIMHDELVKILSTTGDEAKLNLNTTPPANILVCGLQGSGKTTSSAKLALKLKQENKKILLVSLDTYRPAAQQQLEILAKSAGVDCLPIIAEQKPLEITTRAINEAKLGGYDVVIYDTAGRLHIDEQMIEEVQAIKAKINPIETILVLDSMIGQDAVNIASNFDQKLTLTALILTRIDGDAKGGAALSAKYITQRPIKFLSTGEKIGDFESFDAERIASKILDMGDIVAFVEKAASIIDQEEAQKTAAKLKKGTFNMNDYLSQMRMIKKMGGFGSMLSMMPGVSKLTDKIKGEAESNKLIAHQEAIILSMTKKERRNPDLLNASRKKRIAAGSGTSVQQVNNLLKQFMQISTIMKKVSKMNPKELIRSGIGKLFGGT